MGACAKVLTGNVGTFTSLPVVSFLDHLKDAYFFRNHKTAIEGFLFFHFVVSVLLKLGRARGQRGRQTQLRTFPQLLSQEPSSGSHGCGVRALVGIQTLQLTAV